MSRGQDPIASVGPPRSGARGCRQLDRPAISAVSAIGAVTDVVDGIQLGSLAHSVCRILAKNPTGWVEVLTMITPDPSWGALSPLAPGRIDVVANCTAFFGLHQCT